VTHPTTSPDEPEQADGITSLHSRLRKLILDGVYPPGTLIPQEELARTLGVSRTPLREVLRLLQKEGLVEAGRYQRSRVAPFAPTDLDTLYAGRIQLETLGIILTVPHLQQEELEMLDAQLSKMRTAPDFESWEEPHRRFHQLLVRGAGKQLCATMASYADQSQRYRRLLGQTEVHTKSISMVEHGSILEACQEGNREEAAQRLARHLARTALSVLAHLAPEYEPVAVRTALHLAQASAMRSEDITHASKKTSQGRTRHQ
jgi:DNA-binding GntR family transcriptional regulator